jgi:hypothetical protein
MKALYLVALILGAIALVAPRAALADETFAATHCDAAVETGDWSSVTVYCQAAAEEYLVLAAGEDGDIKAVHTASAAFYMTDVGVADRHLGDDQSASERFSQARRLFRKAISETHNKEALSLANKGLSEVPQ